MRFDSVQISSLDELFDLPDNQTSIKYKNEVFKVRRVKGYRSLSSSYQSDYVLLNDRIVVVASQGDPQPVDIKSAAFELIKWHEKEGLKDIDLIWDVRQMKAPNLKVRRQIIQSNKLYSSFCRRRWLIITQGHRILARIYKYIYSQKIGPLFFVDSVTQAVENILAKGYKGKDDLGNPEVLDKKALQKKTKDQLIEMIEKYHRGQELATRKILEAVGHISWEGKFKRVEIEATEDEPNFELGNAFAVLQQDVEEMIRDYRDLNQNLELKVAERIVDFIDKESNLRAILDNSDRVTWLMNNRYELIDFNTAFSDQIRSRFQRTPKVNDNLLDYFEEGEEKEAWKQRIESALEGKPGIYLDQVEVDEGQDQVLEIKTFPIKEIGKIKGVSVFIEDITELKNSQFKLIEKNRDLQKVNSELDSFVYRVSHDLRAPFTSILGLINLMKIETDKDKIGGYIELQEKSIKKLDLFIKEIVNLSRNSRLGITASKIDFNELMGEVYEGQQFLNAELNVDRRLDVQDGMTFYSDRQRLSIILNNLVSNSLKYADSNEKAPFVEVKVYEEGGSCVIEVLDNGIGISEVFLPKIYKMFFRATEEFNGSGLGLYIVKETVEKLKGTINVKSKTRVGTTVKVVLPNLKQRFDAAPKLED